MANWYFYTGSRKQRSRCSRSNSRKADSLAKANIVPYLLPHFACNAYKSRYNVTLYYFIRLNNVLLLLALVANPIPPCVVLKTAKKLSCTSEPSRFELLYTLYDCAGLANANVAMPPLDSRKAAAPTLRSTGQPCRQKLAEPSDWTIVKSTGILSSAVCFIAVLGDLVSSATTMANNSL